MTNDRCYSISKRKRHNTHNTPVKLVCTDLSTNNDWFLVLWHNFDIGRSNTIGNDNCTCLARWWSEIDNLDCNRADHIHRSHVTFDYTHVRPFRMSPTRDSSRRNSDWIDRRSDHFWRCSRWSVDPIGREDFAARNVTFCRSDRVGDELRPIRRTILSIVERFEWTNGAIANRS